MNKFTKAQCQQLRTKLNSALELIGEELDMNLSIGTMSYSDKITCRVTATPADETPESLAFKAECGYFGLKPKDLNSVISFAGEQFKLVGLNPRAKKYPLLGKNTKTGQVFKLPSRAAEELRK